MAVTGAQLSAAGRALLDPASPERSDPAIVAILGALGRPLSAQPSADDRDRGRLLRAAIDVRQLFRLASAAAPGLQFFGAEVSSDAVATAPGLPPLHVAGSGLDPLAAVCACLGEAVERLSCVETADDRDRVQAPPAEPAPWLQAMLARATVPLDWMPVERIADGGTTLVPVDLCLRRMPARRLLDVPWPLSSGCAAGRTMDEATLRALLELIERDAVALWWRGGIPAAPLALEDPALGAAASLIADLRGEPPRLRTWLLDITTDLGVPVVAAVSFGRDGGGFCCGTAARPGLAGAAAAAIMELAQMELAIELAEAKSRAGGDAALAATDREHLHRHAAIHARRCPTVHPGAPPREYADLPDDADAPALAAVLDRLAAQGIEPLRLDLTRPRFDVPVARVFAPGLERERDLASGPRLTAALRTGDPIRRNDKVFLM